jgi:hypothetical protein
MTDTLDNAPVNGQRPTFLTVLCILSFIASGIGIIWSLISGLGKAAVDSTGSSADITRALENTPGYNAETAAALETAGAIFSWPFMIASAVLTLVGLYGVIKMWNLKKVGFMIYAGTAAAGIVLPLLFGMPFNIWGLVIPGAFVAMYYVNVKHMS